MNVSVSPASSLIIKGESNVNKFQCSYDVLQFSDSIEVSFISDKAYLNFTNTQLHLKNSFFDCGHKAINRDFNKLLKTDEFPSIKIELISAHNQPNNLSIMTKLNIVISGISKRYDIPVEVDKTTDGVMICGNLPIDINDFNLSPPKKLLGMIKVSNKIEIDFNLAVKTSE
ncbi:YceI family protein [Winogradskyella aurantia]|nr:YceI family protein [Winogradskyella aurantia]